MAGSTVTVKRCWSVFNYNTTVKDAIREFYNQINKIVTDLETLRTGIAEFTGSATWDAGSIASKAFESKDITVTGAALGDFVTGVSLGVDVVDLVVSAQVTATNTVTVTLQNPTGSAIDLASTTVKVRVSSAGVVDSASDLTASALTTVEAGD